MGKSYLGNVLHIRFAEFNIEITPYFTQIKVLFHTLQRGVIFDASSNLAKYIYQLELLFFQ